MAGETSALTNFSTKEFALPPFIKKEWQTFPVSMNSLKRLNLYALHPALACSTKWRATLSLKASYLASQYNKLEQKLFLASANDEIDYRFLLMSIFAVIRACA